MRLRLLDSVMRLKRGGRRVAAWWRQQGRVSRLVLVVVLVAALAGFGRLLPLFNQPTAIVEVNPSPKTVDGPAPDLAGSSTAPRESSYNNTPASSDAEIALDWPVVGQQGTGYALAFNSLYGDYRLHPGLDIDAEKGAPVRAAAVAKVTEVKQYPSWWEVRLSHGNGNETVYRPLEEVVVKEGQEVLAGETIGYLGGDLPGEETESHLHFEVLVRGEQVDPLTRLGVLAAKN